MSSPTVPIPTMTAADYDRAAQEYWKRLPLEHFMEATPQATQREITLESFALLKLHRRDVQYFNELLIQYFYRGQLRQVVPDNMLLISRQPSKARTSFALELEPALPFWVLEYVSASNQRKDYEERFRSYERELKVPYCLLFHPEKQDLRLYRHDGQHYQPVPVNAEGRMAIPELELEVGIIDGWVRFWHQGELLEIPAELYQRYQRQAEQIRVQANQIRVQEDHLDRLQAQAEQERLEKEQARAQAEQERLEKEQARAQAEQERLEKEQVRARAEQLAAQLRALGIEPAT